MKDPKKHIEASVHWTETDCIAEHRMDGIAYTPQQAREIILRNKMAIVIGLEHAEIGSYFNSVEEEINWIESLGIRHVFPHSISTMKSAVRLCLIQR